MDPANEDAYEATPLRCHACATKERRVEDWKDRAGLFVTTRLEVIDEH